MSGKNPLGNGLEPQSYEGINVVVPVGGWRLVKSPRAPTSNDKQYPVGSIWVDTTTNAAYILTSAPGNWALFGTSSGGAINSITGDSGGAELPVLGNFTLTGTANQIAITGSAGTETFSLVGPYTPATFTSHGVLIGEGTASIAATAAGTNGQVLLGSTGANPIFGTLTSTSGVTFTGGAGSLAINVAQGGFKANSVAGTSSALVVQNTYVANNAGATTFTLPATAAVGDMIIVCGGTANVAGWVIAQNAGQTIHQENTASTTGVAGTATSAAHACESVLLMCVTANTDFVIMYSNGAVALA